MRVSKNVRVHINVYNYYQCNSCSYSKDLLKAAILTGFSGGAVAVLFQILLAPDVALTQAVVSAVIIPEIGRASCRERV